MGARFPTRREDGSFTVAALFQINHTSQAQALAERLNRTIRDRLRDDSARLRQEFASMPRLERPGENTIAMVFEGRSDAALWKDWMVMLTREVAEAEGARFVAFEDRVSGQLHPPWPISSYDVLSRVSTASPTWLVTASSVVPTICD